MTYQLKPIGLIRTPYSTLDECPRNIEESGPVCRVIVNTEFKDALSGLDPGHRILILYWMDQASFSELILPSRKTGERKGIFALRTPQRPNPIGIAEVPIESIDGNCIYVKGLDCLDKTPLIDIKPTRRPS